MRNIKRHPRDGVILPVVAVLSVVLMLMVVFFVDVAYMQLTRTELQAAVDASAKAACEALDGVTNPKDVKDVAIAIAAQNQVAGQPFVVDKSNVELGRSVMQADGSWEFQAGVKPHTAVRVTGIKNAATGAGAINLFFSGDEFAPTMTAVASQFEHEIVLCVDRSGSMRFDMSGSSNHAPPMPGEESLPANCRRPNSTLSRWAALYSGVDAFLTIVQSTGHHMQQTVGLVTWGSDYSPSECTPTITFDAARLETPLGFQYSTMRNVLTTLGQNTMCGRTNMSAGLDAAIAELTKPAANPLAKKSIILFTDGQWNEGDDPTTRASTANANNITIHVVSLLDGLDLTEVEALAGDTGGIHYNATTEQELIDAFEALALSLPVVLTK